MRAEKMDNPGNLDRDRFLALHREVLRIRALDDTALRGPKDGLVLGAIHPSIGQEAIAAGVADAVDQPVGRRS